MLRVVEGKQQIRRRAYSRRPVAFDPALGGMRSAVRTVQCTLRGAMMRYCEETHRYAYLDARLKRNVWSGGRGRG